MSLSFFQHWIGPLLPRLKQLDLFNWSEPLLHEELYEILHWTAKQNPRLRLRLSTNGILINEEAAKQLVYSPVQALTVTFAGLTREDYLYYHGMDKLENLIHSLRILVSTKEQLGSPTPLIRLRYLRFPFNLVSSADVRRWVKKHLTKYASFIDNVTVRDGYLCGFTLSDSEIEKDYFMNEDRFPLFAIPLHSRCRRALDEPAVRADGAVFSCCAVPYRKEYILGFLGESSFQEIWDGSSYRRFRETFTRRENPVCRNCVIRYLKVPFKIDRYVFQRIHSRFKRKVAL